MDFGKKVQNIKTPHSGCCDQHHLCRYIFCSFSCHLFKIRGKYGSNCSCCIAVLCNHFDGWFCCVKNTCLHQPENKIEEHNKSKEQAEQHPVNIFTANGNIQAEMIMNTLKQHGIIAYGQDLGDAGFASVRYGLGKGIDDRIAIFVADEQADDALQVINGLGL